YLTRQAAQQGYYPEWGVRGTALIDSDGVGQLYDQSEWAHAFGTTALGRPLPLERNAGVVAYRSVRPDRPANVTESLYDQMYELAIGIQLAGPTLTPATFEAGMFAYGRHSGPDGAWQWGPGKYTPEADAQVIWWDPRRPSAFNGRPGAYVAA